MEGIIAVASAGRRLADMVDLPNILLHGSSASLAHLDDGTRLNVYGQTRKASDHHYVLRGTTRGAGSCRPDSFSHLVPQSVTPVLWKSMCDLYWGNVSRGRVEFL